MKKALATLGGEAARAADTDMGRAPTPLSDSKTTGDRRQTPLRNTEAPARRAIVSGHQCLCGSEPRKPDPLGATSTARGGRRALRRESFVLPASIAMREMLLPRSADEIPRSRSRGVPRETGKGTPPGLSAPRAA